MLKGKTCFVCEYDDFILSSLFESAVTLLVLVHASIYREAAYAVQTRRISSVKPISFVLNWYTPTPTATVVARSAHMNKGPRTGNLRLCT